MARTARHEDQVSNGGSALIALPYSVDMKIEGIADILFHAWNCESVEEKSKAAKGSDTKKTDDVESYVYRNSEEQICIPGRYITRAIVEAGRFYPDPRSARKMAKDLVQASVICEDLLSPILVKGEPTIDWEYLDRQRVTIMRSAITRTRPAFTKGWECKFRMSVLLPEYISPQFLRTLVDGAGKFIGLADFRPTYGRFVVTEWNPVTGEEIEKSA